MKERPILFSGAMVRAILAGTKMQTRRAWRVQPPPGVRIGWTPDSNTPYGKAGDRLWVRETWSTHACFDHLPPNECPKSIHYWADGQVETGKGRPSIHMPRWASRITLEITGVRVERLQSISEADALAEGIVPLHGGGFGLPAGEHFHFTDPRQSYWSLWEAINGDGSVEANPWVWVIEFARSQA